MAQSLELAKNKYPAKHAEIIQLLEEEEFLEVDEYNDELKEIYFKALQNKVKEFKKTDKADSELTLLQSILEGLEYQEDEVRALSAEVEAHQKHLINKKWNKGYESSVGFVSFQRHVDLKSSTNKQKLINTAKASCFGAGLNIKNSYWSLTTHGCFLVGNSNIKEKKGSPQYKESAVPLWGAKLTQRFGMIVSSSGAEIGLAIPFIFQSQNLKSPGANYKVVDDKNFMVAPALYGRWALEKLYFDTEIGQFMDQSNTYYSLSVGYKF